jgi:hypothetical protein
VYSICTRGSRLGSKASQSRACLEKHHHVHISEWGPSWPDLGRSGMAKHFFCWARSLDWRSCTLDSTAALRGKVGACTWTGVETDLMTPVGVKNNHFRSDRGPCAMLKERGPGRLSSAPSPRKRSWSGVYCYISGRRASRAGRRHVDHVLLYQTVAHSDRRYQSRG